MLAKKKLAAVLDPLETLPVGRVDAAGGVTLLYKATASITSPVCPKSTLMKLMVRLLDWHNATCLLIDANEFVSSTAPVSG